MNKDILITGEWDGMPIWRRRTVKEGLLRIVVENESLRGKSKPQSEVEGTWCGKCGRTLTSYDGDEGESLCENCAG